jgi:preprotein translocase subunit SecG
VVLVLTTVHIIACVLLIVLVLLQQGKGADIGSTLGGDSSSLFGPMAENPLKNITTIVAILFMTTSVVQAYRARYDTVAEGGLFSNAKVEPVKVDAVKVDGAAPSDVSKNVETTESLPKPEEGVQSTQADDVEPPK